MAIQKAAPTAVDRVGGSTSMADVLDRILDKGLVIDAWIKVSLVGIEIVSVEARVVVASVDTFLRYAEAIGRMRLESVSQPPVEAPHAQRQLPSAQEIADYLQDHGEGMSLDQLADHFGASREALAEYVRRLGSAAEGKARHP